MSLSEAVIGWLAPPECVGCQAEGDALCIACEAASVLPFGERCFGCNKLSPGSKSCTACRSTGAPSHVWVATDYVGMAKSLVQKYKFAHQRAAAEPISRMMNSVIMTLAGNQLLVNNYLLVPIPTASGRIRQRSFDHTGLLAKKLSGQLGLEWAPALTRIGQCQQVGAARQLRKQQVKGVFLINQPIAVKGRHVILVDDVVTTGATLAEAAQVLRNNGARSVDAAVFAKSL